MCTLRIVSCYSNHVLTHLLPVHGPFWVFFCACLAQFVVTPSERWRWQHLSSWFVVTGKWSCLNRD